ncbi:hypothetical protein JCM24511_03055 [Saitozyma sp. JCM 24511]|nr:hypothetical protein JCM24511_03055 [Saitozyma sp. JCM 24511]
MLNSARQGCSKALPARTLPSSTSWCQALPAESSTQAILRLSARPAPSPTPPLPPPSQPRLHLRRSSSSQAGFIPPRSGVREVHGKAQYSAAAAVAHTDRASHSEYQFPSTSSWSEKRRPADFLPPRPPDPPSASASAAASRRILQDVNDPSPSADASSPFPARLSSDDPDPDPDSDSDALPTTADQLSALIHSKPLRALVALGRIPLQDVLMPNLRDVESLIFNARAAFRNPRDKSFDRDDAVTGLGVIRTLMYAGEVKRGQESLWAPKFSGKKLSRFLDLCVELGANELMAGTFRERLQHRNPDGSLLIRLDSFVRVLAESRKWRMIIALFSSPGFPFDKATSLVLENLIQAHLAIQQPETVPRLFERYAALDLPPTANAFAHLTQAYLDLGDMAAAQETVRRAKIEGSYDESAQQLALLRGYRALGHDAEVEKRVLTGLALLNVAPRAALLNALIRLRLDQNDIDGAELLLQFFDLEPFTSHRSKREERLPPTESSVHFAVVVLARRTDLAGLRRVFAYLGRSDPSIGLLDSTEAFQDNILAVLVRTLSRARQINEAYETIKSAIIGVQGLWPVPPGVKPGNRSLNALLQGMITAYGLGGIEKVYPLFAKSHLKPDDTTLRIVLDFARDQRSINSIDLVKIVSRFIEENPHLRPKVSMVDQIMAHAVPASAREKNKRQLLGSSASESLGPAAGLGATEADAFKQHMRPILQSLRDRNARSTSRSLANRLRLDAQTLSSVGPVPSARVVWSALLSRGFKPTRRHLLALLQGYVDAGEMGQAQEMISLADGVGVQVTKAMFMTLIVGWGRAGEYEKARASYLAVSRGTPRGADTPTVCAMIQAAYRCRKWTSAANLARTDLLQRDFNGRYIGRRGKRLGPQATLVAFEAFRRVKAFDEAIYVAGRSGPALSSQLRRRLRQLHQWLSRSSSVKSKEQVDEVQRILDADDVARPAHSRQAPSAKAIRKKLARIVKGRSKRGSGTKKLLARLVQAAEQGDAAPAGITAERDVKGDVHGQAVNDDKGGPELSSEADKLDEAASAR